MSEGAANFITSVTALAALVTAGTACWGLHAWKGQLKWGDGRSVGKGLLLELRGYERTLVQVGDPILRPYEFSEQLSELAHEIADQWYWKKFYALEYRRIALCEQKNNLLSAIDEACCIWGDEVEHWFDTVFELENEFANFIQLSLRVRNPDALPEDRKDAAKRLGELRNCSLPLFGRVKVKNDFWQELSGELATVRSRVRAAMK